MKRVLALILLLTLLSGCAKTGGPLQATWLDLFDTVTTVTGYGMGQAEFQEQAQAIHDALLEYHQLFDIYGDYPGIQNLKTVNDKAGLEPVTVDKRIVELLLDCRVYREVSGGKVNAAMGSVLSLWHEARTLALEDPGRARLPDRDALEEASAHTDFDRVVIDAEASTVFITDPELRLDVGAVAKGWAVERVARELPEGLLLNVGGNIRATGPKDEKGTPWVVGIRNPEGEDYLDTLEITGGSVVTSGDYQRTYTVNGVSYHHIIDPDTRMPAAYWRSVTVVCPDSGLADFLSTALFLLPQQEGQALLDRYGARAMWVSADGSRFYSTGFETPTGTP